MSDDSVITRSACEKIISFIFQMCLVIIFAPPALIMTIAFGFICCFYLPCRALGSSIRDTFIFCFGGWGYAFMSPFILLALVIMSPVLCYARWAGIEVEETNENDDEDSVSTRV